MTYSNQPMLEFLELLRTWAVSNNASTPYVDKIDELISDYDGSLEEKIEAAEQKVRDELETEINAGMAEIDELRKEAEKHLERIAELENELAVASKQIANLRKFPWQI